ncbi:MAG: gfo/Idh/MocA family oxidoreductase, partial [Thermoplasmata archaeon]
MKVGVVGVGSMGQHHARVYSEIQGVELVGVADRDYNKAKEIAGLYNCKAFSDYRELLPLIDAVSIAVPTELHGKIAIEFLKAGKDVLI